MSGHVVLVSGGMDSLTLLHVVRKQIAMGEPVHALSIYYGQRHKRELECAREAAVDLSLVHHRIMIPAALGSTSALTWGGAIPEGHYAAETMRQTVVPGRNMTLLSLAAGYAEGAFPNMKAFVYYAAHAGDHYIYPDCRPGFVYCMRNAIEASSGGNVTLQAPFMDYSKYDILKVGVALGVDYGKSWTCYQGGDIACGKCGSCCERLEAFDLLGVADPLEYADRESYKRFLKEGANGDTPNPPTAA